MLCQLGNSPGSPDGASSSTHHDRSLGTDDSPGFDDRSTHADYNEGSRPGRDADAANPEHPGGPGATGQSEHACGALPNVVRYAHSAERICSRSRTKWYDRECA